MGTNRTRTISATTCGVKRGDSVLYGRQPRGLPFGEPRNIYGRRTNRRRAPGSSHNFGPAGGLHRFDQIGQARGQGHFSGRAGGRLSLRHRVGRGTAADGKPTSASTKLPRGTALAPGPRPSPRRGPEPRPRGHATEPAGPRRPRPLAGPGPTPRTTPSPRSSPLRRRPVAGQGRDVRRTTSDVPGPRRATYTWGRDDGFGTGPGRLSQMGRWANGAYPSFTFVGQSASGNVPRHGGG